MGTQYTNEAEQPTAKIMAAFATIGLQIDCLSKKEGADPTKIENLLWLFNQINRICVNIIQLIAETGTLASATSAQVEFLQYFGSLSNTLIKEIVNLLTLYVINAKERLKQATSVDQKLDLLLEMRIVYSRLKTMNPNIDTTELKELIHSVEVSFPE